MIYLDNAATTFPKPSCVTDEMTRCIKKYCGNPGRSSHRLSMESAEQIYNTRELLSGLFNVSPENVVFTYNTTYALNIAIKSFVKKGFHVLISDIEHNSVFRPFCKMQEEGFCSFDVFSTNGDDEAILENIKNALKPSTKMIVCTHVSNIGVRTLPIEKIGRFCKENGLIFIVDGAQSAGVKEIDIQKMNVDALCVPGHKSLYGPQGVGAVLFRETHIGPTLTEGGTGVHSLDRDMPDFLPERYESGTLATPNIVGLKSALQWLTQVGIEKVRKYEETLYFQALSKLQKIERVVLHPMNDYGGNTLLFNVDGIDSSVLAHELDLREICVRSGYHCSPLAHKTVKSNHGGVRISFGLFNKASDIDYLCENLEKIIEKVHQ